MAETPATTDLQRLIGELRERLRQDATGRREESSAAPRPAPAPVPPAQRPMSDAEALEMASVQRRQLVDAFLHGREGRDTARAGSGRGLWAGLAVAVAIALCVGLVAMVQATMAHGGPH